MYHNNSRGKAHGRRLCRAKFFTPGTFNGIWGLTLCHLAGPLQFTRGRFTKGHNTRMVDPCTRSYLSS